MAFGGAGGLFATLLAARARDAATIVMPPLAGNFSAWGLLGADLTQTTARTMLAPLDDESAGEAGTSYSPSCSTSCGERRRLAARTGAREAALDLRYRGQEYSLTVGVPVAEGAISADSERHRRRL